MMVVLVVGGGRSAASHICRSTRQWRGGGHGVVEWVTVVSLFIIEAWYYYWRMKCTQ